MVIRCLSCRAPRNPRTYLCRSCWYQLPVTTRVRLTRPDSYALARLRELNGQLTAGVPLGEIEVAA
ncbi:hypothetical protein ACIQUE_29160 [Bacillus cereus]|uniref:hypothetical protein n=1 Tax=Bacillati TaxID=1783272 RepID=UPI000940260D|nr:hypothetical protein [Streptomyces sp. CB03234]OKK06437.1 hypothetical protein AMK26_10480 [Streptomyces sp. CB03234]